MFTAASIDHVLLSLAAATPPVTTTVVAGTGGAPSSAKALEYLVVTSLDWSGRVLGVIVILIVAWMTAAWARRSVYRIILKAHADITVASFAGNHVDEVKVAPCIRGKLAPGPLPTGVDPYMTFLDACLPIDDGVVVRNGLRRQARSGLVRLTETGRVVAVAVAVKCWGVSSAG